jgi:dipeptidyl aminopeptidase/acylaminoacyl peptidase
MFTTQGGETAHAFFYPPFSHKFTAPHVEKTPVLVKSHGGPTASASNTVSLAVQFWTSRGIGVLDVNYRGSTGYGRSYRLRLKQWGIFDVQDCICGARYLVAHRNADPDRLWIRRSVVRVHPAVPAKSITYSTSGQPKERRSVL